MSQDEDGLKNAALIIERFGGIRPMAAKVRTPVTTVQGWKKRDLIPAARKDDILKVANENNIDLSDILVVDASSSGSAALSDSSSPAGPSQTVGENFVKQSVPPEVMIKDILSSVASSAPPVRVTQESAFVEGVDAYPKASLSSSSPVPFPTFPPVGGLSSLSGGLEKEPGRGSDAEVQTTKDPERKPERKVTPPLIPSSITPRIDTTHEDIMAAIAAGQKKAVRRSLWATAAFVGIVALSVGWLAWPVARDLETNERRISVLEGSVSSVERQVREMDQDSQTLKGLVPEDIRASLKTLSAQADSLSKTVLGSESGALSDRISVIEAKLADVGDGQAFSDLLSRIRNIEVSLGAQDQMGGAIDELRKIVDALDGQVNMLDDELAALKTEPNSPLGNTLQGVSNKDLKAAAILIAFAQFRDSLDRQAPFSKDLSLLRAIVGDNDPELQKALDRLAPLAEKGGVLTSDGLSKEFRGLAGEIVVASIAGENLSFSEKLKARISQALNLKKEGEIVGGTQTQKTVAKAQSQLDSGDIDGAIATLQTLKGGAAEKVSPFITRAQASLVADEVQDMVRKMIAGTIGGGASVPNSAGAAPLPLDQMIEVPANEPRAEVQDEDSPTDTPASKGFKGLSQVPAE